MIKFDTRNNPTNKLHTNNQKESFDFEFKDKVWKYTYSSENVSCKTCFMVISIFVYDRNSGKNFDFFFYIVGTFEKLSMNCRNKKSRQTYD